VINNLTGIIEKKSLCISQIPTREIYFRPPYNDLFNVILLEPTFQVDQKVQPFRLEKNSNDAKHIQNTLQLLNICVNKLEKDGSLLVYSIPKWLPYFAEYLMNQMTFKYWIAIKNENSYIPSPLMSAYHEGILMFVKSKKKFTINKVRYPHIFCSQCGDYLADWGGKKHLRNAYGPIVSDVWDDRDDFIDSNQKLNTSAIERLLDLVCKEGDKVLFVNDNLDKQKEVNNSLQSIISESKMPIQVNSEINSRDNFFSFEKNTDKSIDLTNNSIKFTQDEIYIGDCVNILNDWELNPKIRFDLIFADPPYNLEKSYGEIDDNLIHNEYIKWCDNWLLSCSRLLKPYGVLFVLNLPKWSIYHATLLNKYLWFQRWIVWDALSDPRGNIMPAHYSLLMYTKHPTSFTYNQISPIPKMDQCLRSKCISSRSKDSPKEALSDIWYDIHRIKHKRDRDNHPCQLPVKLLERIIKISTKPGDLVLDPFMGTGTTAIVAKQLGRHYVGIDIDPQYKVIAQEKLNGIKQLSPNSLSDVNDYCKNIHQLTLFN